MWIVLAGCTPTSTVLTVHPEPDVIPVFQDFLDFTNDPGLSVDAGEPIGRGRHVVLRTDPTLQRGAYRIIGDGRIVEITGDVLGQQFGLAAVLESAGLRFVHPQYTSFPVELVPAEDWPSAPVVPEVDRNGLHLHTLHPIEAYYDLAEPSPSGLVRARQLVDWVVKNRGNHVQWPLLERPLTDTSYTAEWQAHVRAVVDYAHSRGVTVGLGVQLFGGANLQKAFDLIDGEPDAAEIDARLAVIAPLDLDEIELSFGEFFSEDPAAFLAAGDLAVSRIRAAWPDIDIATSIHVGGDQRVTWDGREMGYYFLAQYLEDTLPRVHTVMYYNLFEDAGGAYELDSFQEHRDFLLERLAAGEPVGYHPESAYWVAFDVSVPTFLPLYVRSRFTDLEQIAAAGVPPLQDHVLFSSGWEWGYWLNDAATLRMAHHRPAAWGDVIREIYGGWGESGALLADAVVALGELQHEALIDHRLAPYLAGRDAVIDFGDRTLDIHSQPDRPQIDEVAQLDAVGQANLAEVVVRLDGLATDTSVLVDTVAELGLEDPVFEEVRDGLAIDALRARFVSHIYGSALAAAQGQDAERDLVEAESILAQARDVVDRRHAVPWWTGGDRIFSEEDTNATLYQSGYLAKAEDLCFWDRERAQLTSLVRGTSENIPPCT